MTRPPEHLRNVVALRPLRGRRAAVVVCADDPADFERHRDELYDLDAQLVVEQEAGQLSALLGRPSVTVTDRWLDVTLHDAHLPPDEAIKEVRWLEMRCLECPQSGVDMKQRAWLAERE